MRCKLLLVALLLSLQPAAASAQDDVTGAASDVTGAALNDASVPVERLAKVEERDLPAPISFDHIGMREGLPQSSARVIVQDQQGFVWIGTEGGLARYDGHNIRVFQPEPDDPTSILGEFVTALSVHPSGHLWVGTDAGVNIYDPATDDFTRLVHDPDDAKTVSPGGVNDIVTGQGNVVWLAPIQGGLDRVDPETNEVRHFSDPPLDTSVISISEDEEGTLWLGTASGLVSFEPAKGTSRAYQPDPDDRNSLSKGKVSATLVDSTGVIWVGTEGGGLHALDPKKGDDFRLYRHDPKLPHSISDDRITSLLEDRSGRIWIGTMNGLNRFHRQTGRFTEYNQDVYNPRSLPVSWIETIYQDRGGVIWVGLNASGIALMDDLRLSFAHHRTQVAVLSFAQEPDGTIWAGTIYGGGLYKIDPEAKTETVYRILGEPGAPNSIRLDRTGIWGLHRDQDGTLWLGTTHQGLIRFDPETSAFKHYVGLGSDWIWDFWEHPSGMLWLATWGGGLITFDPREETTLAYDRDSLPGMSNNLYEVYPDPEDEDALWLGTADEGVCRLNRLEMGLNCFQHDEEDPSSLSGNSVTTIHRDSDGALWVGTYGNGLNRLDPKTGKAKRFQTANSGLTNNTIYGILPDKNGKLWLSTSNGLFHFDPDSEEFVRYGAEDGLQSDEFALGSYLEGRDGELIFGGVGGFNVFKPDEIKPDDYVPPVTLTGFRSFNENIPLGGPIWTLPEIEVSYTSSFEFEFAALSFAAPGSNRFAYKLEGIDNEWIEGRRFASYRGLPGGDYTLRVRAANRHGVWNEEGVALALLVTPAPWKTWWAYSLYALAVLGVAVAYRYYNKQKLRRLEQANRLEAVERDLELTGAVQNGFLPAQNFVNGHQFRLFGFYRAADACSGDWWWYEPRDGALRVLVGDVTGHGPGPAMVTAAVATAFRVQTKLETGQIEQTLMTLNQEVRAVGGEKYHMTLCAIEVNEQDGAFKVYSAGGPPPLRLKSKGRARPIPCRGTPLGTLDFEAGRVEGKLEPGERILLYTDGLPELPMPEGRLLGMRRFSKMFEQTRELSLQEATSKMVHEADLIRQEATQEDDWTLVLFEWAP